MRNIISGALILIMVSVLPIQYAAADPCEGVNPQTLLQHVPIPKFVIANKRPINDACEVILKIAPEGDLVPVYVFKEYVIAGDLFKNKVHVTLETLNDLEAKEFQASSKELDDIVALSYKPQGATKYIYMVTDPLCPHCEKAKYQIKELADSKKVEIKVIFYPIPAHEDAKPLAIKAVCSKIDYTAYLNDKYGDATCKEGEDKIDRSIDLLEKLGIYGTPTFVSPKGAKVTGYDQGEDRGSLLINKPLTKLLLPLFLLPLLHFSSYASTTEDINDAHERAKQLNIDTNNIHTGNMSEEAAKSYQKFKTRRGKEVNEWANRFHFDDGKLTLKSKKAQSKQYTQKRFLSDDERIYIFVSSSIPSTTLVNYAETLNRLRDPNIIMVLRGCIDGCSKLKPTISFIRSIIAPDEKTKRAAEFDIDPFLFRLYKITTVPAILFAKDVKTDSATVSEGLSKNLKSTPTPYVVYGDVSLQYAVEKINAKAKNPRLNALLAELTKGWYQ